MQALRRVRADVQMEERVLGLSKSSLRETSNDATFQTSPQSNIDFGVPIAPNAYSPPPAVTTEFSDSRQGSAAAPDTETPMMVDEIDWNEMNKWFSPDMLAADLNNPEYDLSQFNAGYPMDGSMLAGGMMPTQPRDMSDVNLSSTTMYPVSWSRQTYNCSANTFVRHRIICHISNLRIQVDNDLEQDAISIMPYTLAYERTNIAICRGSTCQTKCESA